MYNAVSCRSYSTGKVVLTFSSTACTDKTLESYRAKALAAAIKVHDSLWESGTLSYDMSQYEIARTYFQWLCDHCRYDNAARTIPRAILPTARLSAALPCATATRALTICS